MTSVSASPSVSANVIQTMFNHLASTYPADEAREILTQKFPNDADVIASIDASKYTVTNVEMGKVTSTTEPGADLKTAVKDKVVKAKKAPKVVADKAPSKVDMARELYFSLDDKSRANVIKEFIAEFGMSKAMASTYFYNVKE